MADFFQTSVVKKPIPTDAPDLFVRRDITPTKFREIRELSASVVKLADDDPKKEEKGEELLWQIFQHFICDEKGEPFENEREQLIAQCNQLIINEMTALVFKAIADVGKPQPKTRRRK